MYYVILNRRFPFENLVKAIRFACCQAIMHGGAIVIDELGDRVGSAVFLWRFVCILAQVAMQSQLLHYRWGIRVLGRFFHGHKDELEVLWIFLLTALPVKSANTK